MLNAYAKKVWKKFQAWVQLHDDKALEQEVVIDSTAHEKSITLTIRHGTFFPDFIKNIMTPPRTGSA
jgi:hypothetical protein